MGLKNHPLKKVRNRSTSLRISTSYGFSNEIERARVALLYQNFLKVQYSPEKKRKAVNLAPEENAKRMKSIEVAQPKFDSECNEKSDVSIDYFQYDQPEASSFNDMKSPIAKEEPEQISQTEEDTEELLFSEPMESNPDEIKQEDDVKKEENVKEESDDEAVKIVKEMSDVETDEIAKVQSDAETDVNAEFQRDAETDENAKVHSDAETDEIINVETLESDAETDENIESDDEVPEMERRHVESPSTHQVRLDEMISVVKAITSPSNAKATTPELYGTLMRSGVGNLCKVVKNLTSIFDRSGPSGTGNQ